jgi:hypothetical protein
MCSHRLEFAAIRLGRERIDRTIMTIGILGAKTELKLLQPAHTRPPREAVAGGEKAEQAGVSIRDQTS